MLSVRTLSASTAPHSPAICVNDRDDDDLNPAQQSSPVEEEKDDVTKAALDNDDGFFDPLVFNRSFFDPLADKQQSSSPTESTTTDQMDLINLTTPLTKGQAEQHAKEAYLNTIDKRVTGNSSSDDCSCRLDPGQGDAAAHASR